MRKLLSLALVVVGCGSGTSEGGPAPVLACDELSVPTREGCVRAGPKTCGAGFTLDATRATCEPLLPAESCARGTFAAPGETACHPVRSVDPPEATSIVYVDASAAGGGDGSAARPFKTVQAGVDAAATGAQVRIAAGTYAENVLVARSITLFGVDPTKVELRGVDATKSTLDVRADASVVGVAISGAGQGLTVRDARVTASHLWVHDTGKPGFGVDRSTKSGTLALSDSLVEGCAYAGVAVFGATAEISGSVVRDTRISGGAGGPGVLGQLYKGVPATLVVRGSLVERNHEVGIGVAGGSITVESSVVRDTGPMADGSVGTGVLASFDKATKTAPTLVVRDSLVAGNLEIGISQTNGEGTIERTVVRGTRGAPARKRYGVGVQADPGTTMTIRESVIEDNRHLGIAVFAATASIERTIVRGTRSADAKIGGVGIGLNDVDGVPAAATIVGCLIVDNQSAGVMFGDGTFGIASTVVRATIAADDGRFGDGVLVAGHPHPDGSPVVDAKDLLVEKNARAGVAVFGGALRIGGSRMRCNVVDLDRGDLGVPAEAIDGAGNTCGCGEETVCRIVATVLEPVPFPESR